MSTSTDFEFARYDLKDSITMYVIFNIKKYFKICLRMYMMYHSTKSPTLITVFCQQGM